MWLMRPNRYGVVADYTGVISIYSLRKFFGWSNAVVKIRRSSDSATAFVFFDGSSSQDTITTSSFISLTSNTTPDTSPNVTLSTFLSTDDGFVEEWIIQRNSGTILSTATSLQTTTADQPKFATTGVIETVNGRIGFDFDGTNDLVANNFSELGSGSTFTILSVASHTVNNAQGAIWNTATGTTYLGGFVDRRTQKRAIFILGSSNFFADLIAQINSSDQRIITGIHNATNIISHYNGTLQNTTAHLGQSYGNTAFTIGIANGATKINGTIQEIIIFPSDETGDNLTLMHTDIDTYYSIP